MLKCLVVGTLLLVGAASPAPAQSAPAAPALAADAAAQPGPYCTVTGLTYSSLGRMRFTLSYGENAPKPPENQLFVEQQRVEALRTPADMLNYLATRGWELVASSVALLRDGQFVYQYVLRKRVTP